MSGGPRVCLLSSQLPVTEDDNAALLAAAFARREWRVHHASLQQLRLDDGRLLASGCDLAHSELVWVLGFGSRGGFLDCMQLLAQAVPAERFATRIEALLLWHGKHPLHLQAAGIPHPQTFAASTAEPLLQRASDLGGRWVVKPPGGSFGRQLVIADGGTPALRAGIESVLAADPGGFCLLQRYLPTAASGEHRVLVAGGRVIAAYGREPAAGAANLTAGGTAQRSTLSASQQGVALRMAQLLQRHGIGYAGVDMIGDWVLEANIVNPGGLATLRTLEGVDHSDAVVAAVLDGRAGAH